MPRYDAVALTGGQWTPLAHTRDEATDTDLMVLTQHSTRALHEPEIAEVAIRQGETVISRWGLAGDRIVPLHQQFTEKT